MSSLPLTSYFDNERFLAICRDTYKTPTPDNATPIFNELEAVRTYVTQVILGPWLKVEWINQDLLTVICLRMRPYFLGLHHLCYSLKQQRHSSKNRETLTDGITLIPDLMLFITEGYQAAVETDYRSLQMSFLSIVRALGEQFRAHPDRAYAVYNDLMVVLAPLFDRVCELLQAMNDENYRLDMDSLSDLTDVILETVEYPAAMWHDLSHGMQSPPAKLFKSPSDMFRSIVNRRYVDPDAEFDNMMTYRTFHPVTRALYAALRQRNIHLDMASKTTKVLALRAFEMATYLFNADQWDALTRTQRDLDEVCIMETFLEEFLRFSQSEEIKATGYSMDDFRLHFLTKAHRERCSMVGNKEFRFTTLTTVGMKGVQDELNRRAEAIELDVQEHLRLYEPPKLSSRHIN